MIQMDDCGLSREQRWSGNERQITFLQQTLILHDIPTKAAHKRSTNSKQCIQPFGVYTPIAIECGVMVSISRVAPLVDQFTNLVPTMSSFYCPETSDDFQLTHRTRQRDRWLDKLYRRPGIVRFIVKRTGCFGKTSWRNGIKYRCGLHRLTQMCSYMREVMPFWPGEPWAPDNVEKKHSGCLVACVKVISNPRLCNNSIKRSRKPLSPIGLLRSSMPQ